MEPRNIKLTIEDAIKLYNDSEMGKTIALSAYSKEEILFHGLPKSWEEYLPSVEVESLGCTLRLAKGPDKITEFYFRDLSQAKSISALLKLEYLASAYRVYYRDHYSGKDNTNERFYIRKYYPSKNSSPNFNIAKEDYCHTHIMTFPSIELASMFLNNFKNILLTASDYIY